MHDSKCGFGGGSCGRGCTCSLIIKILLIVGGINWGLVGVGMLMSESTASWNVVNMLLGSWPMVEAIVYILVGVAAVMKIFGCKCKKCAGGVCDSCGTGGKTEGNM